MREPDLYVAHGLTGCRSRTSGMAQDVVTLLDFVGWTDKFQIHVVGVSLGGMIAQGASSCRLLTLAVILSNSTNMLSLV